MSTHPNRGEHPPAPCGRRILRRHRAGSCTCRGGATPGVGAGGLRVSLKVCMLAREQQANGSPPCPSSNGQPCRSPARLERIVGLGKVGGGGEREEVGSTLCRSKAASAGITAAHGKAVKQGARALQAASLEPPSRWRRRRRGGTPRRGGRRRRARCSMRSAPGSVAWEV